MLTLARQQPYERLSDDAVIDNLTHFYNADDKQVRLHSTGIL